MGDLTPLAPIERISTTEVAQSDRLDYWNRMASETFAGLCIDSERDKFNADMRRWRLGDIIMFRPRSPAATVQRALDRSSDAPRRLILHLQHAGHCLQYQGKQSCEIGAGDFVLVETDSPYRTDLSNGNEMLVAELPRAALEARMPRLEDRLMKQVSGASPGGRLLHDFLLSLWRHGDQSQLDPAWLGGVGDVFLDLLSLALTRSDAPSPPGGRLRDELTSLVEARLYDPELRTASLAEELGVSMRTVQSIFAGMGTTPSAYILSRRLDRAAERLIADPSLSITVVAFELGFNDCSYFARCFRQRYGMAPTTYRARH